MLMGYGVGQGVSGLVKDRMARAAEGTGKWERPMLLFPEVHTSAMLFSG